MTKRISYPVYMTFKEIFGVEVESDKQKKVRSKCAGYMPVAFSLLVYLSLSFNAYGTNTTIALEEVTSIPAVKNSKLPISDENNLFSGSVGAENSLRDSLSQPRKKNVHLKLEGKISGEDINRLGDTQYKTISLYRAYSQEDLPCLKNNYFIVSPSTFTQTVQCLNLTVCSLTDEHLKEVGQFKRLRKLNLHGNLITERGVDFIVSLTQLRILGLGHNEINDSGVEKVSRMPNLTALDISSNTEVTGKCVGYILKSESLRKLNIKFTSITRKEFSAFKKNSLNLTRLVYDPRPGNY